MSFGLFTFSGLFLLVKGGGGLVRRGLEMSSSGHGPVGRYQKVPGDRRRRRRQEDGSQRN